MAVSGGRSLRKRFLASPNLGVHPNLYAEAMPLARETGGGGSRANEYPTNLKSLFNTSPIQQS